MAHTKHVATNKRDTPMSPIDPTYAMVRNTRYHGGAVVVSAPTFADHVQLVLRSAGTEASTFINSTDAEALIVALRRVLDAQADARAQAQLTLPEAA